MLQFCMLGKKHCTTVVFVVHDWNMGPTSSMASLLTQNTNQADNIYPQIYMCYTVFPPKAIGTDQSNMI